jgi:hypothetical protein
MVKNTGEPGGGPFIAVNPDGSASPQVVETSQMDMSLEESRVLLKNATHFNPVDLVCSLKNYKGEKFDLMKFRDMNTGFISPWSGLFSRPFFCLFNQFQQRDHLSGFWFGKCLFPFPGFKFFPQIFFYEKMRIPAIEGFEAGEAPVFSPAEGKSDLMP